MHDSRTILLKQTFGVNLATFEDKPTHVWLEALTERNIQLTVRTGARIAKAGAGEGLTAGRCDETKASMDAVPLQAIERGDVYCIFVPNQSLVVCRVERIERESPMALIEMGLRVYRR